MNNKNFLLVVKDTDCMPMTIIDNMGTLLVFLLRHKERLGFNHKNMSLKWWINELSRLKKPLETINENLKNASVDVWDINTDYLSDWNNILDTALAKKEITRREYNAILNNSNMII